MQQVPNPGYILFTLYYIEIYIITIPIIKYKSPIFHITA